MLGIEDAVGAIKADILPTQDGEVPLILHPLVTTSHLPPSDAIYAVNPIPIRNTKERHVAWLSTNTANGSIRPLAIESSALDSTSIPTAAIAEPRVHTPIIAPFAAISTTAALNVTPNEIYPIITKLKPDAWEIALKDAGILEKYADILVGLREGFHCGLENFSLSCTFTPPNHYTSKEDEEFIIMKYAEEIELGRISHGYNPDTLFSLIGHYRTAPLAVIEQAPGKRCVIVNHSYPKNGQLLDLDNLPRTTEGKYVIDPTRTSINTVTDSKKFQCTWGSFAECYLLVADAPIGSEAAVFDVDAAFRNIPTHPSARRFLAFSIKGLVHLDHVLNFGATPAPGTFGRVADAIVEILLHRGVETIIKWVDDFIFLRYLTHRTANGIFEFRYSADLIWLVAQELGWPWAPSKFMDFATKFLYIGFLWDLDTKIVELPEKKKQKYKDRIASWTFGSHHTVKEAEQIIGTLNHICLVLPEGRTHLVSLYKFRSGFKNHHAYEAKHKLPFEAAGDISWWNQRLKDEFLGMKIIRPPEPLDTALFVDASTGWGIGLVLDGKWLAWQLKDGWNADNRGIGWAEMVAVELAVRTLLSGKFTNCHIIIQSDNMGVVGALGSGRSRGTQQNLILRKIVKLIQSNELWISSTWISTKDNPADDPSRGNFPRKNLLYAFPPKIPFHLTNFVHKAVDYHDTRLNVPN